MTIPVLNPSARRITFVIEKLAQRSGGAERVLIETANALSKRGHHVEIVSHEYRGRAPFYPVDSGVILSNLRMPSRSFLNKIFHPLREILHSLPDIPGLDRLVWLSRNGSFWRRLQKHLRATRPDVVIGFMPPAVSAIALAHTNHTMRRVASMHNAPEQDFHNSQRWDPSRFDQKRRFMLMSHIDRIAVLLPEYREWYPQNMHEKITVLPNAVTPVLQDIKDYSKTNYKVIAVGRLATVKRHQMLIKSWSIIAPRFPQWKLYIFGEGPLKDDLTSQIKSLGVENSVFLMGHSTDIDQHYINSCILAHPAEFEGFPLAVTESLASGLPVIGFEDCSGLNRLVKNDVNGILVSAEGEREENFAQALSRVMEDSSLRTKLGAGGPPSVAAYSPEKVIDMWEDLLWGSGQ